MKRTYPFLFSREYHSFQGGRCVVIPGPLHIPLEYSCDYLLESRNITRCPRSTYDDYPSITPDVVQVPWSTGWEPCSGKYGLNIIAPRAWTYVKDITELAKCSRNRPTEKIYYSENSRDDRTSPCERTSREIIGLGVLVTGSRTPLIVVLLALHFWP